MKSFEESLLISQKMNEIAVSETKKEIIELKEKWK